MTSSSKQKVGFVGLGHMGGNMATRLLAAGYEVYGEQRSREHAQHLVDEGLRWKEVPRAVAEAAEIIFTSLPDDAALTAVASGQDGLLAGLTTGKVWADPSTVSPRVSRELAEEARAAGAAMLDAPVSGSVPQVQSGTLTIMVGGDEDAYRRVEPVARTGRASRSSSRSTSALPCRCSPSPRAYSWRPAPASTRTSPPR